MLAIPFLSMVLFLLIGLPIAFSIGIAGIIGILLMGDLNTVIGIVGMGTFGSVASYVFSTVPMFIAMAFFASSGGLAEDLFDAADRWFSNLRGGLAIGTVFACGIFGAMSGVSSATASVMSELAIPNMRRLGYSEALAAGTVGVGATLDMLIPPSVAFVVYGFITGTSIGKLLIAGIIPGIILGIFLIICISVWVTIRPQDAPGVRKTSWALRWKSLWRIWPSLVLIVMVTGVLYAGVCTPTEAGAIGAFLAAVIGISIGKLDFKGIVKGFKATLRITAMILMILMGAYIFNTFIALTGLPEQLVNFVMAMGINRWVVMVGIIVAYFVISMFMDELPLMLLFLQFTFPLIIKLGFDPIWYGVISLMMIMMGLVFPPVGMLAFIVSGVSKINLMTVYKGTSILMIAILLTTLILMLFPAVATWLPSKMM
jgi:tripartite ATP-independent transporter DctM subunit